MKILIGILSYNRKPWLEKCLDSVSVALPAGAQIAVADDGSDKPEVLEYLRQQRELGKIRHLIEGSRGGVARNSNRLIKLAKQGSVDLLFLLNDDIEVKKGVFEIYADAVEKTGFHFSYMAADVKEYPHKILRRFGYISAVKDFEAIELKEALTSDGVFLTYSREMIEKLGGFDTKYFFSCEHLDGSRRASHAGFTVRPDTILDVQAAEGYVFVPQYQYAVPRSVKDRNIFLNEAVPKWLEEKTLPPVIYKEIET